MISQTVEALVGRIEASRGEEDGRDRHAAFVARSDRLRTGDLAGDDRPHFEASVNLGTNF